MQIMRSPESRDFENEPGIFSRDEDGSLTIFSLFIFIVMLMFGGIAVDLMIYENKRVHAQNSTDRAVLAAANLNQSVDPTAVVIDYLAKSGIAVTASDVSVVEIGSAPVSVISICCSSLTPSRPPSSPM